MFIPGVLSNLPLYLLSIVIGTGVTAGMLFVLKRPIAAPDLVSTFQTFSPEFARRVSSRLVDTEQERLEEMDRYGIEKQVISTNSPAVSVDYPYESTQEAADLLRMRRSVPNRKEQICYRNAERLLHLR